MSSIHFIIDRLLIVRFKIPGKVMSLCLMIQLNGGLDPMLSIGAAMSFVAPGPVCLFYIIPGTVDKGVLCQSSNHETASAVNIFTLENDRQYDVRFKGTLSYFIASFGSS